MTHVSRTPALVSLNQLGFQFANGATLFEALNLNFDGQPTAIVGHNGVGKSVLARLIAGICSPLPAAWHAQLPRITSRKLSSPHLGKP